MAVNGHTEKRRVAAISVGVATTLTLLKLGAGLATGSLGILAEAAHSGLDLMAAFVTFLAVSISSRPPDQQHHYGHGKIENISALFETLLLLITCVWIIYEAVQRLFFTSVSIEPSIWAFAVMFIALGSLFWISRLLYRTAIKYQSQALEADALHFKTDIWSTIVVILGLTLVVIGDVTGQLWLTKADAVAALIVALIVVRVSLQLGRRTVEALIDTAPPGLGVAIEQRIVQVPGVEHVDAVRVRTSGPETFADVTISVSNSLPLEEAHSVAVAVENAVREVAPDSDVMVHTDPHDTTENVLEQVRLVAARMRLDVHNIAVQRIGGHVYVALDLEVAPNLSLGDAHELASALERRLREEIVSIARIDTHIEPRPQAVTTGHDVTAQQPQIVAAVKQAIQGLPLISGYHSITVLRSDGDYNVSVHCTFDPATPIADVHEVSDTLSQRVRAELPSVHRVVVHTEP